LTVLQPVKAAGKYKNAMRPLKYPGGYIHPTGYVAATVCFKKNGIWEAGYVMAHRPTFSWWHKMKLTSDDVIHHVDGDKTNNHWSNLSRLSAQDHRATALRGARKSNRRGVLT
jgi:hypothetical protein